MIPPPACGCDTNQRLGHWPRWRKLVGPAIFSAWVAGGITNFARTLVGVMVMTIYVVAFDRLFWRRHYHLAETRYSLT